MNTLRTLALAAACIPFLATAQDRFGTRNGHISFHSDTPVEKIEAHNHKVSCVYDVGSGAIQFSMLIKAFEFEKALMQEHFNENYMESNTYPKSEFKGTVEGFSSEMLGQPGTHPVTVSGVLTIHGASREVKHPGTITVGKDGTIKAESDLIVKPEDHDIKIPGVVRKNIAEEITVKVRLDMPRM
jgi:polyisoprenoid-binding protein YceI